MEKSFKNKLKRLFPISIKDIIVSILVLASASLLCYILISFQEGDAFVPMIFVLAVLLVSRYTDGYLFGVISAGISVLGINYIFTYPYYEFNFTLSGYPLTIACTLAVAILTSTLTTKTKLHSSAMLEVEREKTRGNLLRAVSHDLRTPLTSILGASSAIIENDDKLEKSERIKLLGEINEDAQWLIRMVENLLSITRIDGDKDKTKISKRSEVVEEIVADAILKFKKRFKESVSVELPDELFLVPMDAMLIEQVLINLFENAVIHGKTTTQIKLIVRKSADFCEFIVSDNGNGIAQNVLPHIFEGYFGENYEQDGDTKKNMGIGLSVCNTIVKAHGGAMKAQNNEMCGASFTFTIPLEEQNV